MRKDGLPICQHILIGLRLQQASDQIRQALNTLNDGYPRSAPAIRHGNRTIDRIDQWRCELDSRSAGEHPGQDDWAPGIYYGGAGVHWEKFVLPILRRHQKDRPPCCKDMPDLATPEGRRQALAGGSR